MMYQIAFIRKKIICKYWGYTEAVTNVFYKKGVLKNFAKFTRKHLCQSLSFNKVAGLRPATLSKKRFCHRWFTCEFSAFFMNIIFTEHLWRTTSERLTFYKKPGCHQNFTMTVPRCALIKPFMIFL